MNKQPDNYQPVSCALHSELELAIIHRQPVLICWNDETMQQHNNTLYIKDILTENHEEYILVQDRQQQLFRIRLDRIKTFTPSTAEI